MSSPLVFLPAQFEGESLPKLAADVVTHSQQGWPPEITFDFSTLRFIRPAGVVFLSNLVYWLNEKNTKVSFHNIVRSSPPLAFLDDSLFFEQHCGAKLSAVASPRATTRPLIRIAQRDSHQWLQTNLLPWLASRLNITEASLHTLKVCLSEIFNNIQDHTRHDIGSIFVQHFPKENAVVSSISDMGLGIPQKVREKLPGLTDQQAILKAVEEGFTTKSKPSNKGIGLDYLLKTVVLSNGGEVTIYSCEGILKFYRNGTEIHFIALPSVGFCPGTTIDIKLRTDTIEILPEEREDLQW
jgi:anti-sigma regulatory factor (Ser/Thr protein kinase)